MKENKGSSTSSDSQLSAFCLGVAEDALPAAIRIAYKKKAQKSFSAEELAPENIESRTKSFRKVGAAYQCLMLARDSTYTVCKEKDKDVQKLLNLWHSVTERVAYTQQDAVPDSFNYLAENLKLLRQAADEINRILAANPELQWRGKRGKKHFQRSAADALSLARDGVSKKNRALERLREDTSSQPSEAFVEEYNRIAALPKKSEVQYAAILEAAAISSRPIADKLTVSVNKNNSSHFSHQLHIAFDLVWHIGDEEKSLFYEGWGAVDELCEKLLPAARQQPVLAKMLLVDIPEITAWWHRKKPEVIADLKDSVRKLYGDDYVDSEFFCPPPHSVAEQYVEQRRGEDSLLQARYYYERPDEWLKHESAVPTALAKDLVYLQQRPSEMSGGSDLLALCWIYRRTNKGPVEIAKYQGPVRELFPVIAQIARRRLSFAQALLLQSSLWPCWHALETPDNGTRHQPINLVAVLCSQEKMADFIFKSYFENFPLQFSKFFECFLTEIMDSLLYWLKTDYRRKVLDMLNATRPPSAAMRFPASWINRSQLYGYFSPEYFLTGFRPSSRSSWAGEQVDAGMRLCLSMELNLTNPGEKNRALFSQESMAFPAGRSARFVDEEKTSWTLIREAWNSLRYPERAILVTLSVLTFGLVAIFFAYRHSNEFLLPLREWGRSKKYSHASTSSTQLEQSPIAMNERQQPVLNQEERNRSGGDGLSDFPSYQDNLPFDAEFSPRGEQRFFSPNSGTQQDTRAPNSSKQVSNREQGPASGSGRG